jgi:hypothetical protein
MAGDEGFEPSQTAPKAAVLPLDESPKNEELLTEVKYDKHSNYSFRGIVSSIRLQIVTKKRRYQYFIPILKCVDLTTL